MNEVKIWRNGLIILLVLQVIIASVLIIMLSTNFPSLLEQFDVKYQPDMGILQFIMAYNLFLSLSLCLWSVIWIRKNNAAGFQAGITFGVLLLMVSVAVFIKFDKIDILLFDGLRAFLMVMFGVLAYREHKKNQAPVS